MLVLMIALVALVHSEVQVVNIRDEIIAELGGATAATCVQFYRRCRAQGCQIGYNRECWHYSDFSIYVDNTVCEVEVGCMAGHTEKSDEMAGIIGQSGTCQDFYEKCTQLPCYRQATCYRYADGTVAIPESKCYVLDDCPPPPAPEGSLNAKFEILADVDNCEQFSAACQSMECYEDDVCWAYSSGAIYMPKSRCIIGESCEPTTTTEEPTTTTEEPTTTTTETPMEPSTTRHPDEQQTDIRQKILDERNPADCAEFFAICQEGCWKGVGCGSNFDPSSTYCLSVTPCSKDTVPLAEFKEKMLSKHNILRSLHRDTPPMVWDDTIAAQAQSWSEHLASNNLFEHSSGTGYGENIWKSSSNEHNGLSAVQPWYDEIDNYSFTTGSSNGGVIGHFTQVVWKKSVKLGCGRASGSGTVVTCNYSPQGNYGGQYLDNVMPRN